MIGSTPVVVPRYTVTSGLLYFKSTLLILVYSLYIKGVQTMYYIMV